MKYYFRAENIRGKFMNIEDLLYRCLKSVHDDIKTKFVVLEGDLPLSEEGRDKNAIV